jgi:hypothetical protein
MSVSCQQETHALQELAGSLRAFKDIKRDQHALLAWSSGRRPAASEGDYLKRHQRAVANSCAICAKPGWSACR